MHMRIRHSPYLRRMTRLTGFLLLAAIFAGALPASTVARPVGGLHGPQPFVTVLCRFAGEPAEPESPDHFRQLLLGADYPSLDHYWRSVSYNAINLSGSIVIGWYALPNARESYRLAWPEQQVGADSSVYDLQRLARDCVGAARAAAGGTVEWQWYAGLNLVFNETLNRSRGGRVCLAIDRNRKCFGATWLPDSATREAWAHEMGHAFGLKHSSGDDGQPYEDVWDIMGDGGACWPDQQYGDIA
jgi:hypothetical protein